MRKFFLVGCPRSGTTMFQQALNRHSRIVIPPETSFFFLAGFPRLDQKAHICRINRNLGIELTMPASRIDNPEVMRSLYERLAELYVRRLGRSFATHFGDKSPEHQLRVAQILEAFPDARILLLYRDGRDVALSLCNVPWLFSDLDLNFSVWLHYYHFHQRLLASPCPQVCFIKYENLVTAPHAQLKNVLDFLGLEWEPQVVDGHGNTEGILPWEYWKNSATERITSARVGGWRRELSEAEIRRLEIWGGKALRSLGYELVTGGDGALPFLFFPKIYIKIALWLVSQPRSRIARETVRQAVGTIKEVMHRWFVTESN